MTERIKAWIPPILVTSVDVIWGWSLATHVRPWFFEMLKQPEQEASTFYDNVMEPRLWIGYAIVLATQLIWVYVIAPRPLTNWQLRLYWWLGFAILVSSSVMLRQGLPLHGGPSLLLLGVQIGDILLLYWLATRLLTPLPQRSVIPGWW